MFLLIGNQSIYQKFFSARTERDARLSVVGWLGGTVLLELLIVGIAVLGAALFLHTPGVEAREIIPYTARNGVPSLVGAILVGAIFAKVISTANNYLFSPATNLVNDLYIRFVNRTAPDRTVLRVSRVLIAVLGLFALLQGAVRRRRKLTGQSFASIAASACSRVSFPRTTDSGCSQRTRPEASAWYMPWNICAPSGEKPIPVNASAI